MPVFFIPFPALIKIQQIRLRLAVASVYLIGIISVVTATLRVVLLVLNPGKDMMKIITLSSIETATHVIAATIPGISGAFITRYMAKGTARESAGRKQSASSHGQSSTLSPAEPGKPTLGVGVRHVNPDVELNDFSVGGGNSMFANSTEQIVRKD